MSISLALPLTLPDNVVWFKHGACVVKNDDVFNVYVAGTLVASFGAKDYAERNSVMCQLGKSAAVGLGQLAKGVGMSPEAFRQIRRLYEKEGLRAVVNRSPGGDRSKVTKAMRRRIVAGCEAGQSVRDIHAGLPKRTRPSRSVVGEIRKEWADQRSKAAKSEESAPAVVPQIELPLPAPVASTSPDTSTVVETTVEASPVPAALEQEDSQPAGLPMMPGESAASVTSETGSADEQLGARVRIKSQSPTSAESVQHLGSWVMLATVAGLGLHKIADETRGDRVEGGPLRVALDALTIALSVGQYCVEGVRRLATSTASTLLRCTQSPSASWVRAVLGRLAMDGGGHAFHFKVGGELIRSAAASASGPVVFYVDNHTRPYTGDQTLRRAWRMQDKRSTPGCTDFYVHTEGGTPALRVTAPDNPSLTQVLTPIAHLLRQACGPEDELLLAFDRGGAFPAQMSELKKMGGAKVGFVTYERAPYATLPQSAFTHKLTIGGEKLRFHESRKKNLRDGRGRVRRVAVLMDDGKQINILASSKAEAAQLIAVMKGRWGCQENGFRHGVMRWGINHLDGRETEPFPPDTIIPNPMRSQLDRALHIHRAAEGEARRKLSRLPKDHPKRAALQEQLDYALEHQSNLEFLRPFVPKHVPIEDTDLADKLVHHTTEYKATIDTVRIMCANAESELAIHLARYLRRPAEAKQVLKNIFNACGSVEVSDDALSLTIDVAGTHQEQGALESFLADLSAQDLRLPGDPRSLRFCLRSPE